VVWFKGNQLIRYLFATHLFYEAPAYGSVEGYGGGLKSMGCVLAEGESSDSDVERIYDEEATMVGGFSTNLDVPTRN
jgi:hypothetical protein